MVKVSVTKIGEKNKSCIQSNNKFILKNKIPLTLNLYYEYIIMI